jgi:hypothetical protein
LQVVEQTDELAFLAYFLVCQAYLGRPEKGIALDDEQIR